MNAFHHMGVEYVLPGIYKAYPRAWADQFITDGTIYFTNLEVFRNDEHSEKGDPLEGVGVLVRNSTRCMAHYSRPVYVWCSTMDTTPRQVLATWRDRDTILQITDTGELIKRVQTAALAVNPAARFSQFQVGPVTYDKDEGSCREYHWAEGIFQKGLRYSGQKEFRFALVAELNTDNIVLTMGPCSDIARIVQDQSPNHTPQGTPASVRP